ncbi:putative hydrolase of the HAD superfamily [Prauserella shujinwangii]|uniref:Putative hydrolase of the HAD superfamily n=1 Tax=Prauserella shujinwangii TaxID=1453103 RepID=A0A2T0LL32_9PSEU|nr:HAD-IA family hydrolase [Prauserella shujinwangii]PRX43671.1 putative hydrolase of the HAD superfamily [Prauserella shujinwangii]
MNLADHRVLTFDVVGTLVDFEQGILDAVRPLAPAVPGADVLAAFGRAEDRQQRLTPELPFTQMLEPVYERMAGELGLPPGQGPALRASIPRWPAFPDAVTALRALRTRFRLVALTNADNWAAGHFATTLGEPFDDIVTAEDAGVNKPDLRVFAYCLGRQSVHGYRRADHLHVAQSQYHDIGAARAADLRVCWIERGHGRPGSGATPEATVVTTPDLHLRSLAELSALAAAAR